MLLTKGFTLTELLITLTITVLLWQIGLPALRAFSERQQATQDITRLTMLLHNSRELAVHRGERLTLCPDNGQQQCSHDWNQPLMLFADRNNNRQLDTGEPLLHRTAGLTAPRLLSFSGHHISFDHQGFSGFSTGSLGYCLQGIRPYTASLIISRMGRIRRGGDSNQDGIAELTNGQNVPCPS